MTESITEKVCNDLINVFFSSISYIQRLDGEEYTKSSYDPQNVVPDYLEKLISPIDELKIWNVFETK